MSDIWMEEGDIYLGPHDERPDDFVIGLGLLFDPCCLFLAEDNSCLVYEGRPNPCVAFPLMTMIYDRYAEVRSNRLDIFPCLKGVEPTAAQRDWMKRYVKTSRQAIALEVPLLWERGGLPRFITFTDSRRMFELVGQAMGRVQRLGPRIAEDRAASLEWAAGRLVGMAEAGAIALEALELSELLAPAYFILLQDKIAAGLDDIQDHHLPEFKRVMKSFRSLRKEAKEII